jgi:hypothetical protein
MSGQPDYSNFKTIFLLGQPGKAFAAGQVNQIAAVFEQYSC